MKKLLIMLIFFPALCWSQGSRFSSQVTQEATVTNNSNVSAVAGPPGPAGPAACSAAAPQPCNPPNLNNIIFVDGVTYKTSPDIGVGITAAYAALPSTGGLIIIPPNPTGGCYTQTSDVAFNTIGKYVILEGWGPGSTTGVIQGGTFTVESGPVCINYTPVAAGRRAFQFDYTPITGQAGFQEPTNGMRNITLVNNNCNNAASCTTSAEAISIGLTNGGAQTGDFSELRVSGFGIGAHVVDSGSNSWGGVWRQNSFNGNQIGYQEDHSEEATTFRETKFVNNVIGAKISGSGDLNWNGGSIDGNSTCGVTIAAGSPTLTFTATHFEQNNLSAPPAFVCNSGGNANLVINGGFASDDATTSTAGPWFTCLTCQVSGLNLISQGRGLSSFIFAFTNSADISVNNQSPTVFGGANVANGHTAQSFVRVAQPGANGPHQSYFGDSIYINTILWVAGGNPPAIASGFGTSPCVGSTSSGTSCSGTPSTNEFTVNVGTGGTATAGVINLSPAVAANGWNCSVQNLTAHAGNRADDTVMTAFTTQTATVQNQTKSTGAAIAWMASDKLLVKCGGF